MESATIQSPVEKLQGIAHVLTNPDLFPREPASAKSKIVLVKIPELALIQIANHLEDIAADIEVKEWLG